MLNKLAKSKIHLSLKEEKENKLLNDRFKNIMVTKFFVFIFARN